MKTHGYTRTAALTGGIRVTGADINIILGRIVEGQQEYCHVIVSGDVPPSSLHAYARAKKLINWPASRQFKTDAEGETASVTVLAFEPEEGGWSYHDLLEICRDLDIELVIVAQNNTVEFYHRTSAMFDISSWLPRFRRGQTTD